MFWWLAAWPLSDDDRAKPPLVHKAGRKPKRPTVGQAIAYASDSDRHLRLDRDAVENLAIDCGFARHR